MENICYTKNVKIRRYKIIEKENTYRDEHESLAFPLNAASCHIEEGFPAEFLDL